eukprot:TRINITY_DN1628_c0_g4_i1.p1 TRINITY_DN1628_c0_g4~~TRINITY_DN1628_c0_g4_i1.p1  ORF type:complete len:730 (-),score=150.56 TRINITY_DN1628_c0_g4_i1:179-2368(-)
MPANDGDGEVDLERLLDVRDFVEEFLLVENSFNEEDFRAFLLTYRLYCSSKQLLSMIEEVYYDRALPIFEQKEFRTPRGSLISSPDDVKTVASTLQNRLLTIALWWINHRGVDDFQKDKGLVKQLLDFLERVMPKGDLNPIKLALLKSQSRKKLNAIGVKKVNLRAPNDSNSSSFGSQIMGNFLLTHVEGPKLLAEQLTLLEWKLFSTIRVHDLLSIVGGKKFQSLNRRSGKNPLSKVSQRFDLISHWVAFKILTTESPEERLQRIERFVDIARHCYELRNYQTLAQIISGLGKQTVSRIKHIKKDLNPSVAKTWTMLEQLMSPLKNFAEYRNSLSAKPPSVIQPVIPFVALFQRDLVHIWDGSPDRLEDGALNITKLKQIGKTILQFLKFQEFGYGYNPKLNPPVIASPPSPSATPTVGSPTSLIEDEVIQLFLEKLMSREPTPAEDEESLYDLSYLIEAPAGSATPQLAARIPSNGFLRPKGNSSISTSVSFTSLRSDSDSSESSSSRSNSATNSGKSNSGKWNMPSSAIPIQSSSNGTKTGISPSTSPSFTLLATSPSAPILATSPSEEMNDFVIINTSNSSISVSNRKQHKKSEKHKSKKSKKRSTSSVVAVPITKSVSEPANAIYKDSRLGSDELLLPSLMKQIAGDGDDCEGSRIWRAKLEESVLGAVESEVPTTPKHNKSKKKGSAIGDKKITTEKSKDKKHRQTLSGDQKHLHQLQTTEST